MRSQNTFKISENLPFQLKEAYEKFEIIEHTGYYSILSAKSLADGQEYTIRVLDRNSKLYTQDSNQAITLFLQEMFHLGMRLGTAVLEALKFQDGSLAFVTKPDYSFFQKDTKNFTLSLDKVLQDIRNDLALLEEKLKFPPFCLDPKLIRCHKDCGNFVITDWSQALQINSSIETQKSALAESASKFQLHYPQNLEVFAHSIIEKCGTTQKDFKDLEALALKRSTVLYNAKVREILRHLHISEDAKKILKSMLEKNHFEATKSPETNGETLQSGIKARTNIESSKLLQVDFDNTKEQKLQINKTTKQNSPFSLNESEVKRQHDDKSIDVSKRDLESLIDTESLIYHTKAESDVNVCRIGIATYGNNEISIQNRGMNSKTRSFCGIQLSKSSDGGKLLSFDFFSDTNKFTCCCRLGCNHRKHTRSRHFDLGRI